jgi:GNAT superfamily N-acetyltransferase
VHAEEEHLPFLPAIERAASRLFDGWGLSDAVLADETSDADFLAAQSEGLLWVALAPSGEPVGFAFAERLADGAHLDELDVHPDHGRRGVGALLVRRVCEWARSEGLPCVTLTTFTDIPWNATFYERLGFRALAGDELCEDLAELVREEAERGLEPERRVVMRRESRSD